jgi:hypothetical protein
MPKEHARLGLAQGIGQGGGNTANQTRIFLADIDLDSSEALARHAGAMT